MVSLMYNWPWLLYFKYYGQHCPNNSNQFQTVSWSNSNTNLDLHVTIRVPLVTDHFCIFMHCIGLHKGGLTEGQSLSVAGDCCLQGGLGGPWLVIQKTGPPLKLQSPSPSPAPTASSRMPPCPWRWREAVCPACPRSTSSGPPGTWWRRKEPWSGPVSRIASARGWGRTGTCRKRPLGFLPGLERPSTPKNTQSLFQTTHAPPDVSLTVSAAFLSSIVYWSVHIA